MGFKSKFSLGWREGSVDKALNLHSDVLVDTAVFGEQKSKKCETVGSTVVVLYFGPTFCGSMFG